MAHPPKHPGRSRLRTGAREHGEHRLDRCPVRPGLVAAGQLPGERRLMVEPRPVPEGRFVHLADEHLVEAAERVGNLVAEAMNVECALPSRRARVRLEEADWL